MFKEVSEAYALAKAARDHAHAPYSKFKVGAALKIKGKNELIQGCNVENASYGATVCAERTAFQTAVAKNGKTEYEYIVVITDTEPAVGPCGLCLQVMAEFCPPDFKVYLANLKGVQKETTFKELLKNPFGYIPTQVNG